MSTRVVSTERFIFACERRCLSISKANPWARCPQHAGDSLVPFVLLFLFFFLEELFLILSLKEEKTVLNVC